MFLRWMTGLVLCGTLMINASAADEKGAPQPNTNAAEVKDAPLPFDDPSAAPQIAKKKPVVSAVQNTHTVVKQRKKRAPAASRISKKPAVAKPAPKTPVTRKPAARPSVTKKHVAKKKKAR